MGLDKAPAPEAVFRRKAGITVTLILVFTCAVACVLFAVPPLISAGLLAYSFGLRHAVDADHIAAIDNVTRQLTTQGKRPVTVGLFFALGHSSVVTIMCMVVVLASDVARSYMNSLVKAGGVVGACISGTFLLVIGAVNLRTALQMREAWKEQAKYGGHQHPVVGMCTRCCPSLFDGIKHPWQMFPVGFLFGLGFDTSSEIGLLAMVAVSRGTVERPSVMVLPLMFMGGMCLVDTLNGLLMAWAYGKALEDNMQRLYYNLFLTTTSGLIAVCVGAVELLGALASSTGWSGPFWDAITAISDNFEILGLVVIGLFVLSLTLALACFGRVFPGGRPREDPVNNELLRYLKTEDFIDRSGI